jgi:hypothetical protein
MVNKSERFAYYVRSDLKKAEREEGDVWEGLRLTIEGGSGFKRRRHRSDDGGAS